jgi:hypothetical protein
MKMALPAADQINLQIIGASLESLIRPYVSFITFGIDIAVGIIIGLSALAALISFFKKHNKSPKEQTQDIGTQWLTSSIITHL